MGFIESPFTDFLYVFFHCKGKNLPMQLGCKAYFLQTFATWLHFFTVIT